MQSSQTALYTHKSWGKHRPVLKLLPVLLEKPNGTTSIFYVSLFFSVPLFVRHWMKWLLPRALGPNGSSALCQHRRFSSAGAFVYFKTNTDLEKGIAQCPSISETTTKSIIHKAFEPQLFKTAFWLTVSKQSRSLQGNWNTLISVSISAEINKTEWYFFSIV